MHFSISNLVSRQKKEFNHYKKITFRLQLFACRVIVSLKTCFPLKPLSLWVLKLICSISKSSYPPVSLFILLISPVFLYFLFSPKSVTFSVLHPNTFHLSAVQEKFSLNIFWVTIMSAYIYSLSLYVSCLSEYYSLFSCQHPA